MDVRAIAPLIVRIVIGISFILHGKLKVAGGTDLFADLPFFHTIAPFIGWIEIIGGIALVIGLWTDVFAVLLALDMAAAIFSTKTGAGYMSGYELKLILAIGPISLLLSGPGLLSVTKGRLFRQ